MQRGQGRLGVGVGVCGLLSAAALGALGVVLLLARPAAAQVNAEVLRPNTFAPGWSSGFDASVNVLRGNVELLDVGGAARAQFQTLYPVETAAGQEMAPYVKQRFFAAASGRYAKRKDDDVFVNQGLLHIRWISMWRSRVGTEVFAQHQFNEFLRLRTRALLGGGVRADLVHRRQFLLWGGTSYMAEYNRLSRSSHPGEGRELLEHRWNNYLAVRLETFDERLMFQNIVYLQPRFDELRDYRLLDELEMLSKITATFAFGVTLAVVHDSAPPADVHPTDVRLLNTFRFSL